MPGSMLRAGGWFAAGCVAIIAGFYLLRSPLGIHGLLPISTSAVAPSVGDLPAMTERQKPASYTLDGCPPRGQGGDPQANLLRNRADPGDYVDVSFDSLLALTWPKNVEGRPMAEWPKSGREFIRQYAGLPITVEGYIINVREGMPDPATCNRTDGSFLDWHLAFAKNPRDDRSQTVTAEVTPRVRVKHTWTMDTVRSLLVNDHMRVRLSGWLYFDAERPGDVGLTRATLWELNPVMQIQVLDNMRWVNLESLVK